MVILIVEDELDVAHMCQDALSVAGHVGHIATSGGTAAREALQHGADVVLLDLVMPGYDGWAVARDLGADPQTAGIPVVVMSGLLSVHEHAQEIGTPYALRKPYNLADLLGILARIEPPEPEAAA